MTTHAEIMIINFLVGVATGLLLGYLYWERPWL